MPLFLSPLSSEEDAIQCSMLPPSTSSIYRSNSKPQLDLSGAKIQFPGNPEEKHPAIFLPNQSDDISLWALDIGGTLIKLVYFSRHESPPTDDDGNRSYPLLGGRLHFLKFETRKINECFDFFRSNQLLFGGIDSRSWSSEVQVNDNAVIKATGGGAYKFATMFKEELGVSIKKEDEMNCLVTGANFLLKAICHEAFTHMQGQKKFVQIDENDLFPYLLVNIGSGVSMIKVDGDGKYERVDGTCLGGGTCWGLGRLLTKCTSFDELLELSKRGDNKALDMLVGDIYGGMEYAEIGLSATAIASSFGKVVSENKTLEDYKPEDICLSLLRVIPYTIVQIAYLNARLYGLKKIFFGGFFIRGHPYTMDTISSAVHYWSKGEKQAMFLQHEGFLGALGAFMSYEKHSIDDLMADQFVGRLPTDAPCVEEKNHGSPSGDFSDKISCIETHVQKGTEINISAAVTPPGITGLGGCVKINASVPVAPPSHGISNVGVFHHLPKLEVPPLVACQEIDDDDDSEALLAALEAKIQEIKKKRADKKLQKERQQAEELKTKEAELIQGNPSA